jgi:hypothetical protein
LASSPGQEVPERGKNVPSDAKRTLKSLKRRTGTPEAKKSGENEAAVCPELVRKSKLQTIPPKKTWVEKLGGLGMMILRHERPSIEKVALPRGLHTT